MATTHRIIRATPEQVFAVLADGWLFPGWVVGASRMRSVDPEWPHVGSELQHSFGVWPFVLNDNSTSKLWDPPHRFVVRPEGWPFGAARVSITAEPHRRGSRVTMTEVPVSGPATLIPKPLLWLPLIIRNREALHRLGYLAEGGAGRVTDETLAPRPADLVDPAKRRHPLRTLLIAAALAAGGAAAVIAGRRA